MSKRKSETQATDSSELISTGMPWSEVPDTPCPYTEWLGGRHGPAQDSLPTRRSGSDPRSALRPSCFACRSSTRIKANGRCSWRNATTGWLPPRRLAGQSFHRLAVGQMAQWLPKDAVLPDVLRVQSRNDIQ
jgi:hypothetical protein